VTPAPIAATSRRDVRSGTAVVESRHVGHVVVVGPDGRRSVLGDPDRTTFVRSAVKPFQATTCLELAGDAARDLTAEEVAVGWASHQAEPFHLAAVDALLARSGTPSSELTCPPAEGDDGACERRYHNCSGKHALFALAGMHQGTARDHLLDPAGPLQRVVLHLLEEVFGPASAVGTDGCGAPAIAAPLATLARAYASLAVDDRWERVRTAGLTHPELVGGEGRLESALLAAGVVAKVGAEGVFAAGWIDEAGRAHGMALKATDGAGRGVAALLHRTLLELGLIPRGIWAPPPPLGGGRPAGEVLARPEAVDALVRGLRDGR
jgi:L-asparaginase II